MKRILTTAAAVLMAACQPMPTSTPAEMASNDTPVVQTPAPGTDADACAARGGKMLPQGRMQSLQCVVSYADAGRRCSDGDDCQGDCRIEEINGTPSAGAAVVGQCQANSSRFGCYTTVEGGKVEATICVD